MPLSTWELLLWASVFTVFYAYLGYGMVLFAIIKLKRLIAKPQAIGNYQPPVSFIVPCYNERDIIAQKINNTLAQRYPKDKLEIIFISDGSNDGTPEKIAEFAEVKLLHQPLRAGKAAAMNRAILQAKHEIIIFTDANTILNEDAIAEMVKHYADIKTGAVSGEKRVFSGDKANASSAGEGIYWKYESLLKKWDSELLTIVGAAGELFSVRKSLYTELEPDTILDDFMQTMRIAANGYRVIYEPAAYAMETASVSVKEELKRKIRICAGGWQSMVRLAPVLNPFNHFTLTFQYISHRVLRWSIAPICLVICLLSNVFLLSNPFYALLMVAQCLFYSMALLGWYLANREIKVKLLFIPYYFFIMNYSVFAGFIRYIRGAQSAAWERSKRA